MGLSFLLGYSQTSTQRPVFGLPMAQASFFVTTTLILSLKHWILRNLKLYYSSMISQVVTPPLSFLTNVRNLHGMLRSAHREATSTFTALLSPITPNSRLFMALKRCTYVIYDKSTMPSNVHELRLELYSKKSRWTEQIPPTQVGQYFVAK